MSIKIENLCFSYDNIKNTIDNFSIDFEDNQIIGIVGNTGCGKSTLVQLIAGLLVPRSARFILTMITFLLKNINVQI